MFTRELVGRDAYGIGSKTIAAVLVPTGNVQVSGSRHDSRFCTGWKEYLSSMSGRNTGSVTNPNPA